MRIWDKTEHGRLLTLTLPMILANITTPLIGLVDTAVLGHMSGSHYLAGASVAALILTQLYWVCGFIRMSATGLSGQALGKKDRLQSARVLYQCLFSALVIGLLIVLLQIPILRASLLLSDAQGPVQDTLTAYFNVRVWGAPAALGNLALVGWLLGQQRATFVMLVQVLGNLLNVVLDIVFVFVFDWEVQGVAAASIIAEYSILFICISFISYRGVLKPQLNWFSLASLRVLTALNSAMLVRNLALQACLVFITFQGLRLGQNIAAINAILMQFFSLIALGLDAIAYAVEALVAEAKGALKTRLLVYRVKIGLLWSSIFALLYSALFYFAGTDIIGLLTNQQGLQSAASQYLTIIFLLPIIAHWCFLLDGVYVGITRAKAMRDSMLVSALVCFFPIWWLTHEYANWALWGAMLAFLAARGVTLGGHFIFLCHKQRLLD